MATTAEFTHTEQLNLLTELAFASLDRREKRINDYYSFPLFVYEFLLLVFVQNTTPTRNYLDVESLVPIVLVSIASQSAAHKVAQKIIAEFGEEGRLSLGNFLETYEVGWSSNAKKVLEELQYMGLQLEDLEP